MPNKDTNELIEISAQDILWRANDAKFIWDQACNLAEQVNELDDLLDRGEDVNVPLRHHLSQMYSVLAESAVTKICTCWAQNESSKYTFIVHSRKPTLVVQHERDSTMRARIERLREIRNDELEHPFIAARRIQNIAIRRTGSTGPFRQLATNSAFTRDLWGPTREDAASIGIVIRHTQRAMRRLIRQSS